MTAKKTAENKTASNAADTLKDIAADAPPIQLANPKPLDPWEQDPADAPLNPAMPSLDWTLDQLGQFAAYAARRSAEHAWEVGFTLLLVKDKVPHGEYEAWLAKWLPGLNEKTRQRYQKVGKLPAEAVKGKTLDEIYRKLFGEDYAGQKGGKANPDAVIQRAITTLYNLEPETIKAYVATDRDRVQRLVKKLTEALG